MVMLHRVIAYHFHGAPPGDDYEANHINGDKRDNRPQNLHWCKRPENLAHAWRTGLRSTSGPVGAAGAQHPRAKLDEAGVRAIHIAAASGELQRDIAKRNAVNPATVSLILSGKNWPHIYREFHP